MENVQNITLKEALQVMNHRDRVGELVPFDMTYRTLNKKTREGGVLKCYGQAKYLPAANNNDAQVDSLYNILMPIKSRKDPNHYKNRTRNIELDNGQIVSIGIDNIISVNNQFVIY